LSFWRTPDIPKVEKFVVYRIVEITLGGGIGVLASRFILPVRSRRAMIGRFRDILGTMAQLLVAQAEALEKGEALSTTESNIALRKSLVATDSMLTDARRERAMGLVREDVSDGIPRTLWRIRNGIAQISQILSTPFPAAAQHIVGPAVAAMLRAHAQSALDAAEALNEVPVDPRNPMRRRRLSRPLFRCSNRMRRAQSFDAMGRVYGMAFTLRRMQQDLLDLAERIAESR
jgi:hypothetical protein